MSRLSLCCPRNVFQNGKRGYSMAAASEKPKFQEVEDEFRVLNFTSSRDKFQRKEFKRAPVAPPRALQMKVDQKWANVWPGARSFHPAVVPLPLRQGYTERGAPSPAAAANAELMKVPNFLHLTPPAVAAQCAALRPFCSAWPEGLTDEKCEELFPLEIITADYCHSSPSIRDPLSRIVSLRINVDKVPLDAHAKDKFRRLVGERYDENTNILTLVTDRCPTRKQNLDYANYLLMAVYHEAWSVEKWEAEKTEADMEVYVWENNMSKVSLMTYNACRHNIKANTKELNVADFDESSVVGGPEYKEAVSELLNEGENDYQLYKYKMAVKKVFGLLDASEELTVDASNKA